jgi:hypothetical protein
MFDSPEFRKPDAVEESAPPPLRDPWGPPTLMRLIGVAVAIVVCVVVLTRAFYPL